MFATRGLTVCVLALAQLSELVAAASLSSFTFSEPPAPAASPTSAGQRFDLTSSIQNQAIWPNWTIINEYLRFDRNITQGYFGYSITCQTCTSKGTVDISTGGYDLSSSNDSQVLGTWTNSGFVEYVFTGFQMNMTLQIDFLSNFTNASVEAYLFEPTMSKLQLSQKANITFDLWPYLFYALELNKTGLPSLQPRLSVSIPDGALLYANLSHPESSYVHGFSGASVSADFANTTNLPDFSFSQSLGFSAMGYPNASASADYTSREYHVDGIIFSDMILPNVTSTFQKLPKGGSACSDGPDPARQINNTAYFGFDIYAEVEESQGSSGNVLLLINEPYQESLLYGRHNNYTAKNVNVTLPQFNFSLPATCLSGTTSGSKSMASNVEPVLSAAALGLVVATLGYFLL